ncbi:MAG: hypothetical protein BA865_16305 [Desulfobacterales bacterium S5133MH4]|nr:MAG: hypothetical protein BA865_16305 [Desulfobacterales bacterium S5133MH4]
MPDPSSRTPIRDRHDGRTLDSQSNKIADFTLIHDEPFRIHSFSIRIQFDNARFFEKGANW